MTYQFRVIAVNKAGQGVPSKPTDPHVCKHRNCKYNRVFYFYLFLTILIMLI